MAWNIGDKLAAALPAYEQTFKDQIFNTEVLLNHLKENGGVVKKSGGTSVRVPLLTGASNTDWFSGADTLNVANVDTLDAAEFQWRNLNASIVITEDDEWANSGKEQVIDLLQAKIKQAELTISKELNTAMYVGTGVEARPRIIGLQTLVDVGSVGGINGATYTDWQSYVNSTAGALTLPQIRTARNTLNQGKGGSPVSIMVTTQTLFEKYETLLTPTYQMNPMTTSKEVQRIIDGGFTSSAYAGIPVVFDPVCPAGEWYFLNPENLKIFVHKDAFMSKSDKRVPTNQHLSVQHIVVRCALGTNRRKSLGKLTAKT